MNVERKTDVAATTDPTLRIKIKGNSVQLSHHWKLSHYF